MFNRTRDKFILMVAFVTLILLSGLHLIRKSDEDKIALVMQSHQKEKEDLFERIVDIQSKSVRNFVYDYTYWDEMVDFVKHRDPGWAEENIKASISTFGIDVVWVCQPDLSLTFSYNLLDVNYLERLPVSPENLRKIMENSPFSHFFIMTDAGLLEIFGASIHPTNDKERQTPARGYLFAGCFWREDYLDQISDLALADVYLQAIQDNETIHENPGKDSLSVIVQKTIDGWDGTPIVNVISKSVFPVAQTLRKQSDILYLFMMIFSVIIVLFLTIFFFGFIHRPIRQLSKSLLFQDPSLISKLSLRKNEFGRLAGMILEFFNQKSRLIEDIAERKRAEEALKKSEEMFHAIFEYAPTGISIIGDDGKTYMAVNPMLCQMFGYEEKEFLNGTIDLVTHPDDKEKSDEWIRKKYHGEECEREILKRYIHKDGHVIWGLVNAHWIMNEDGSHRMAIAHIHDITERKLAEDAIRKSEEKYRSIFENIQDVYYELDLNGKILELSPSVEALFNGLYRREDLVGTYDANLYVDVKERNALLKILEISGVVRDAELRLKGRGDSVIICSTTLSYQYDEKGKPYKVVGSMYDMTDRKMIEDQLHIKNFALESSVSAIGLTDLRGNHIYANKAYLEMWGGDISENLIGCNLSEKEEGREKIQEVMQALQSGKGYIGEEKVLKKDGTVFYVQMSANLVKAPDGTPVCMMASFIDITERKQAEATLRESEEQYRMMITNSNDLIQSVAPDGHLLYVNPNWLHVMGYALEEVEKMNLFTIIHQDSEAHCQHFFMEILAGQSVPHLEVTFVAKDGRLVFLEGNSAPVKKNGLVVATQGFFHDVTERKQSEKAIRLANERLRLLQKITDSVHESLDLTVIFKRITDAIVKSMKFSTALVLTLDHEEAYYCIRSLTTSQVHLPRINKALGMSINKYRVPAEEINQKMNDERMVKDIFISRRLADIINPPISVGVADTLQDLGGNESFLNIPLILKKKMIGSIIVSSSKEEIPKSDIQMLETFASTAVQAIANADLLAKSNVAKEEVQKSLREKEVLLQELYHRTKNNMQVIASMLRLRSKDFSDSKVETLLCDLSTKIKSMAMAHQKLYESNDLSHLNLKEYIQGLVKLVRDTYGFIAGPIDFSVYGDDIQVLIDTAIPCGLIVNELITNSIKYAFPDKREGKIDICLDFSENKELIIEISDNGVGLPDGFDFNKDVNLGMKLVIDLVEHQLEGKIDFIRKDGLLCRIALGQELYKPRV